jgi:predicted dehydrogenase
MRIGVVGCGYWGSKHVRVLHGVPEVEKVVAIDSRAERLQSLSRSFAGLPCFGDLEASLGEVDGLVIATPPSTHLALALTAMRAGKSVLIEKPLATSTHDAQVLMEEAERRNVTLMVGHTFEYNAAVLKLRELVTSGALGSVYYLDTARLNMGLYQSDVNVIWDLAPHDVSIINYVLGSEPISVQAWGAPHAHPFLEDVAYLRLDYPNATANVHVSWLDPCKVRRVTVVGSSQMAVYNDLATEERVRVYDKGVVNAQDPQTLQELPMTYRYGDIRSPYISFEEPLSVQDRHFVNCIKDGLEPRTSGSNGLAVVKVLEAADVSLREGTRVFLDRIEIEEPAQGWDPAELAAS